TVPEVPVPGARGEGEAGGAPGGGGDGFGGTGAGPAGEMGAGAGAGLPTTGRGAPPAGEPTGAGAQTPPYGGGRSWPSCPGLKKSSRSATGAVLQPATRQSRKAAFRYMLIPAFGPWKFR